MDILCVNVMKIIFCKVDEKGTEAAAVTAMIMATRCAMIRRQPPTQFTIDQPFLFVLRYKSTTVFIGRYAIPI